MELQRIITIDGVTVYAKDFDIYSIISCSDGFDYIVETISGKKIWNIYNNNINEIKNSIPEFIENDLPKLEIPDNDNTVKAPPIKISKPKIINTYIIDAPKFIPEIIADEKIIKKKGRPAKIKIAIEESILDKKQQKKIIKFKEPQCLEEKKLSDYHTFIRNFLSQNSDIVWNERMKAANASWKATKESA